MLAKRDMQTAMEVLVFVILGVFKVARCCVSAAVLWAYSVVLLVLVVESILFSHIYDAILEKHSTVWIMFASSCG